VFDGVDADLVLRRWILLPVFQRIDFGERRVSRSSRVMPEAFAVFNKKSLYSEDAKVSQNIDVNIGKKIQLPIHPEQQRKSSLQKNGVSAVRIG